MAIFISFGLFKDFRKKEVVRKGHDAPTIVEGAATLKGRVPLSRGHLVCLSDSVSLHDTVVKTSGRLYKEFLPTKRSTMQENGIQRAHEVPTR